MLTSMPTPLMIACHPEWRLQWRPYGCGLMVQCWMFSWFHRCIQWRCRVVRGRSQEKRFLRHESSSHHRRNKTGFGMICSQMSMDESCGLGSERYAERWGKTACVTHWKAVSRMDTVLDARSVGDDMSAMRYAARRWLRFRLAGHTGQGLAAVMPDFIVSLPSSGWFQKKCGAVTAVLFFLFSRASHSWRRTIPEARRGMPETAICTWFVLVAGTYMKMRTYCRICMFTSEVMVLSKPEWDGFCRLDYRRSVNISIMKFEH